MWTSPRRAFTRNFFESFHHRGNLSMIDIWRRLKNLPPIDAYERKEDMSERQRKALLLGATGGIGGETGRALSRHGWGIRAVYRSHLPSDAPESREWVKGDAMDAS